MENGAVYPDYRSGDVWLEGTYFENVPVSYQIPVPYIGPDVVVVEYNWFLSFGTELECPFSELLNINDVLIVQPIRDIQRSLL